MILLTTSIMMKWRGCFPSYIPLPHYVNGEENLKCIWNLSGNWNLQPLLCWWEQFWEGRFLSRAFSHVQAQLVKTLQESAVTLKMDQFPNCVVPRISLPSKTRENNSKIGRWATRFWVSGNYSHLQSFWFFLVNRKNGKLLVSLRRMFSFFLFFLITVWYKIYMKLMY